MCRAGPGNARRLDRLLREARPHRHAQGPHPVPRHQARLDPTKCVNLVGSGPGVARSVLRRIRVASKQELAERIMAAIEDINQQPVIHTRSYMLDKAA